MDNAEQHLVFRIIEYCKDGKKVSKGKLFEDLQMTAEDKSYVERFLLCNDFRTVLPNHILGQVESRIANHEAAEYKLLTTALFNYIDYLEIRAAREAASDSKKLAWIAIGISLLIGVIQVGLEFYQGN